MKILNTLIKIIVILLWSFGLLYLAKFFGFQFDPEDLSGFKSMYRLIFGVILLAGIYVIWRINFLKKKK